MSDDKPPPQPGDYADYMRRQVLAMNGLYTFPDTIETQAVTAQKSAAKQAGSNRQFLIKRAAALEQADEKRSAGRDRSDERER